MLVFFDESLFLHALEKTVAFYYMLLNVITTNKYFFLYIVLALVF